MEKLLFRLDVFEGPLDLLLHLITSKKLNIYDIQISELLEQYMYAIEGIDELDIERASTFAAMAAQLLYIKSRMLLPATDELAEDPREELVRDLLEYQRYKQAAAIFGERLLNSQSAYTRQFFGVELDNSYKKTHEILDLSKMYKIALKKSARKTPPPVDSFKGIVNKEPIPIWHGVIFVLRNVLSNGRVKLHSIFQKTKNRSEMVAVFLALLEMIKQKRVQVGGFGQEEWVEKINGDKHN